MTVPTRLQDEVLEDLAGAVRYRRWICDLARPWLGTTPLEIGSGRGDHAAEWAGADVHVTVTDADRTRVASLGRRFASVPSVSVRQLELPGPVVAADHSAVVALNVLEHIVRDVEALAMMRALVVPGGHVVTFVPAFELAMSDFDRRVGHHRRYRIPGLVDKMRAVGLEPVVAHYVNAPGLLAWTLMMRLGRRQPAEGVALRGFERAVPLIRRLEATRQPPFGQSLFVVGRRP